MLTLISASNDAEVSKMKIVVNEWGVWFSPSLIFVILFSGLRVSHAFLCPTHRVWNPKMGLGLELFLSFKHPRPMQLVHGPPKETGSVFLNDECDETLLTGR